MKRRERNILDSNVSFMTFALVHDSTSIFSVIFNFFRFIGKLTHGTRIQFLFSQKHLFFGWDLGHSSPKIPLSHYRNLFVSTGLGLRDLELIENHSWWPFHLVEHERLWSHWNFHCQSLALYHFSSQSSKPCLCTKQMLMHSHAWN